MQNRTDQIGTSIIYSMFCNFIPFNCCFLFGFNPSPLIVREFNDKLLLLERYFRDHRGLPNNNLKHHLILSPAEFKANSFQRSENIFPALFDEIYHITQAETKEEIQNAFLRIEKYFPILINTIREAGNSLLVSNGFFEHSNYEDSTPQLNKFFDDFKISK